MRIFLILILFLFNLTEIKATDPPAVEYLGIEHGLSNNLIRCIYQDHKGFMWFGTRDGLNRYDGYGFKVFRNEFNDPNSLVHNIIHSITSDSEYNLWIGTRQGVSVYNDLFGKFATVKYRPNKKTAYPIREVIKDVKTDRKGNVFIGSEGLGLLYCRKGEFIADQIPLLTKGKETTVYGVQAIKTDATGKIWVFVQNLGLCALDYNSMKLRVVNTAVYLALCMEINGNDIWIGTNSGLFKFDILQHKAEQVVLSEKTVNSRGITSITLDKSGNLWLGTSGNGIYIYNIDEKKVSALPALGSKIFPRGGTVYSIYLDKDSRKWIGTSLGGVNTIDPNKKRFQTIAHDSDSKNTLAGNAVSAFYEDHDYKVWVGTEDSGLNIWDRSANSFVNYKNISGDQRSLSDNSITSMVSDYKNNIWLGTFSNGLNRFERSTNSFERYKCINPLTGVESKVVFTLYQDHDRNLWAGTLRRGSLLGALYRLNRDRNKFELFDTRLTDLFVMNEDSEGTLWGGNLNQLIKIDKITKKHKFYNIGYTVRAIYDDLNGNLWIGTEGGGLLLFNRKSNRITARYTTENGLCNNSVLTILDDGKKNLWMSTYNGISKFNTVKRVFKNFYQSDGLQSSQFQINAALKLSSGEMVFGGIRGFNIFEPSSIVPVNVTPNLLLTKLNVNNMRLESNPSYIQKTSDEGVRELKVPYDKAVFSFEFTALEYSAPNKIMYAYYMDGWDRGWNNTGNGRIASYTHIDEGTYIFKVKCTNIDGVWNKQEIALKITILPPWYRTWWAYMMYTGFVVSIIYIYLIYRAKQTKLRYEVKIINLEAQRKKAEYETEVAKHEKERSEHEKERVINEKEKELNEKRLSFFTNVSHEFRTPLTLVINPVKDLIEKFHHHQSDYLPELNIIHRNARRMLSLVDQLLLFRKADTESDNINASKLNFYDLCREVYLCFIQQANSKMISFNFTFENKDMEVYADREKIEIVLFNLISNALKYTPPHGSVTIRVNETSKEILVSVIDTGYGIPEDAGDKLFERFYQAKRNDHLLKPGFGIGLYLAKQFTNAHSGKLTYKSELGRGTEFSLMLLKGFKHLPSVIKNLAPETESVLFNELLLDEFSETDLQQEQHYIPGNLITDKKSILIVDDESDIRQYIKSIFRSDYIIYEAENGENGLYLAHEKLPDLIITDFRMQGIDGIELCEKIKEDPALSFIPVILLTASSSQEVKLKSLEGGADDYIRKPFEKEYLVARVANLLKNRNNLQNYFYNEITLQSNTIAISEEYKKFLEKCIVIVENHLYDADFGIKSLANEIGMSHSNLYKRVKSISGQSVSAFIRFIRLRKAAELMINTDCNVTEAAFQTGFNDSKYFGKQFLKLFHSNPSEFIKKNRKYFNKKYKIQDEVPNKKKE
ncbi:MAG TPA: two-component regulator propeller domain-containing protein [Pedobacter sp.]|uniref:hybrid sensor histidine kinase/response regulator transcription factor n=1 Tax=Pedobacter sp. TaxID=1411316 RepID=UPI002C95CA6A|nr:two-component regulator propeller domain-containing protein [Pedobacter sp.]HMI05811.1 two-component regulator propeller domain-containing protein [Pedobacter sp.]